MVALMGAIQEQSSSSRRGGEGKVVMIARSWTSSGRSDKRASSAGHKEDMQIMCPVLRPENSTKNVKIRSN